MTLDEVQAELTEVVRVLRVKATDTVPTHGTILCVVGPPLLTSLADRLEVVRQALETTEIP